MNTAAEVARDADMCAGEPAHPVTHTDVVSLCRMISALAGIVAAQAGRIEVLEARPRAGRPPKTRN